MIGCIVQARMGSSRLPGKTLMKLTEKSNTLDFVISQLSFSKLIDKIIIATTNLEEDNTIEQYAKKLKIKCFRGESDDVLDRYYQCAKKLKFDNIVRITADCPLIDSCLVDEAISLFKKRSMIMFAIIIRPLFQMD